MAIQAAQLQAVVSVSGADTTKSTLQDVGKTVDTTGGGFKNVLGGALSFVGGAFSTVASIAGPAIGFVKDQLMDSISVAMKHQDVMTQTAQAIKSTGDASGMSAKSIGDLALSLSKTTQFSDDAVQGGENLLLTFTGIGKKTFPDATKAMLDMSQAMHQGPTQTALMLGKALNDPTTGLTALTRVGVTFSAQEKEQIKTMMAHNDVAGAQAVMLKELGTEFGGSAVAAGKTFGGSLQILKNNLEDVKQQIGTAFLPILSEFVTGISSVAMPVLTNFGNWFQNVASPALKTFGDDVGKAFTYVGNVLKSVNLTPFKNAWVEAKAAIDETGHAFQVLGEKLHPVAVDFDPLADTIAGLAKGGLNILSGLLRDVSVHLSSMSESIATGKGPIGDLANFFKQLEPPIQNIANLLKGELGKEFKDLGQDAQQVGQWFMSSVVPAIKQAEPGFESLGKVILTQVIPAAIQIRGVFADVIQHAFQVFGPIIEKIIPPLIILGGIIANNVAGAIKFLTPYILEAAKQIGKFAEDIMDRVVPIINNAIGFITPILKDLFHYWGIIWPGMSEILKGVFEMIFGVVKIAWSIITGLFKIGLDIIGGNWGQVWTDMKDMLGGIWDGIKTYLHGALDGVKGLFTVVWADLSDTIGKPFRDAWNDISGIFGAIGSGITDLTHGNIPGALHEFHVPGFASGTSYAPGGWAIVGEQGPEAMYVPQGSQIIPNNQLTGSSTSGGNGQPLIINVNLAGQNVAQVLLPDISNAIRNNTGNWGM